MMTKVLWNKETGDEDERWMQLLQDAA